MGRGYIYHCERCQKDHQITTGIGMAFPSVYEEIVQATKAGTFGAEWQELMLSEPDLAINADLKLYLCPLCGHWEVDHDLSLYISLDDNTDCSKQEARASQDCVYPDELTNTQNPNYEPHAHWKHSCSECGAIMVAVEDDDLSGVMLKCPDCKEPMAVSRLMLWD